MAATRLLPSIVGPERAARLLLTGEVITGKEAERIKLVSEAVPTEDVLKRATELAETIAQKVRSRVSVAFLYPRLFLPKRTLTVQVERTRIVRLLSNIVSKDDSLDAIGCDDYPAMVRGSQFVNSFPTLLYRQHILS